MSARPARVESPATLPAYCFPGHFPDPSVAPADPDGLARLVGRLEAAGDVAPPLSVYVFAPALPEEPDGHTLAALAEEYAGIVDNSGAFSPAGGWLSKHWIGGGRDVTPRWLVLIGCGGPPEAGTPAAATFGKLAAAFIEAYTGEYAPWTNAAEAWVAWAAETHPVHFRPCDVQDPPASRPGWRGGRPVALPAVLDGPIRNPRAVGLTIPDFSLRPVVGWYTHDLFHTAARVATDVVRGGGSGASAAASSAAGWEFQELLRLARAMYAPGEVRLGIIEAMCKQGGQLSYEELGRAVGWTGKQTLDNWPRRRKQLNADFLSHGWVFFKVRGEKRAGVMHTASV